nr:receptor protein kinase-like protein ZAR1 [Setaria viridis]
MGAGCLGIGTTTTLRDRMPCGGLQLLLLFSTAKALTLNGQALLAFKAAVVQDPTGVLANWDATVADPCAWNGIACSSSSIDATQPRGVVALSLPKKHLVARLPAAPLPSSLYHLHLCSNRLFGPVPPELIFGAPVLQSLVLYGNALDGFSVYGSREHKRRSHVSFAGSDGS